VHRPSPPPLPPPPPPPLPLPLLFLAAAAAQGHAALHRGAVRFLVELQDKRSSLDPAVEKVIALEREFG